MEEEAPDPAATPFLVCPECGASVDPASAAGPVVECPQCHAQFFPPAAQDDVDAPAEEDESGESKSSQEEELSALRIKQLSTLRRTAYRTRSYLLIGTVGCVWVTIPLIISIRHSISDTHRWTLWATAYALMALAALIGAGKFGVRVVEVQRGINDDLRKRELEEMEAARHEPDLSALSDGSQHARNLERMFGQDENPNSESPNPRSKSQ